ncbi:hypothetical protein AWC38_SpisGene10295 [Stylophora pistillata]|uniref:Integrase catalytic domain-containing protein n=1 Tax=Stylophora pistillata TaxID=50429 RepID=A0A2B4S919_STYPI|nr:hypothetical protein AWC38_SpisGene10295 [Stylophora pistillata]
MACRRTTTPYQDLPTTNQQEFTQANQLSAIEEDLAQCVLRLFIDQEVLVFTVDELQESRSRLVDASGTLMLIEHDLTQRDINVTGIPTEAVQLPIRNLRHLLVHLINLLSAEIEKSENYNEDDTAYHAPLKSKPGPGRKPYDISKERVEHLRSLFFSWTKIAAILQVSISTLQRRRREFGLSDELEKFSDISDDELDRIYATVSGNFQSGPLTPNIGRRRFIGALRSRGLRVQRWRVSECLHRVDPVGTTLRWRMAIRRRKYYVPTPNSLWHIDSGHKLIRYKLITHVCIDGKTRLLVYVHCCNNNKADTVLSLFEDGVQRMGLPSRVRSDYGMENIYVAQYMLEHRGEGRGSIITGSSVHNCRVEGSHRDIYAGVLTFYSHIFEAIEDEGILDVLNDVHLYSLHHVFIPCINKSLQEFVQQMNNHPVSSEKNKSPLQMWQEGMLENIHSGHTALNPSEIDDFGVDPEGLLSVEEEDYQVNIECPSISLSEQQIKQLPNPLQVDDYCGIGSFLQCVETVNRFQQ